MIAVCQINKNHAIQNLKEAESLVSVIVYEHKEHFQNTVYGTICQYNQP